VEGYVADDEPSASDAARIQAKRDKSHGPGGLIKVQPLAKCELRCSRSDPGRKEEGNARSAVGTLVVRSGASRC
jgi:hypothetical protein